MAKRDYYEVLGVPKSAGADEIKKAHRKLVRQYHPDVNRDDPKANEQFKEVQEAYDVLSDAQKRQNYDQFGHAGVAGGFGGGNVPPGADPFEAFRRGAGGRARSEWRGGPGTTVEDFDFGQGGNGAGFADIFEQLFGSRGGPGGGVGPGGPRPGGARGHRGGPRPEARGSDIEHPVTLTFEQAARGVTLPLQINREGRIETIDVKIPPGVKDGSRIRIKGRGQQGPDTAGDLYIVTSVRPHAYFKRDGLDVSLDVPVSLYEAMLGTKIDVPTLDGPVTITIPPGTSSGAKLRIKARGIERGEEKGDQHCIVKVVVPKDLDEQDKEAVKQLQAKRPLSPRADTPWSRERG